MVAHHPSLLAACVGLASLAAPSAARAQSADLSYSWPAGLVLRYAVHNEIQQETVAPGFSAGSQIVTDSTIQLEVVGERRGEGQVEFTTEALRLEADLGPLGDVRFDSANPRDQRRRDNPDVAPFIFMLDKTYTVTLSPAGEVKRLEGYAQHLDRMLRGVGDEASRIALEATLNESVFRAGLEQTWHILPGEEVDVGDSWPVRITQDIAGVGQVIIEVTYTLEAIEEERGERVATISADGRTRMGRSAPGVRVRISDSVIEGEITFAADLGLLLEMDVTNSFVFDMTGPTGAIQLSMDAATILELQEVGGLDAAAAPAPSPRIATPPGERERGGKPN